MKICFLTNNLSSKDGWGRYSASLLNQIIKKREIDCRVLLSEQAEENQLPQINVYKILPPLFNSRAVKLFSLIKNYWKIRKLIEKSDIIHSLIEPYGLMGYLMGRKKPLIITLHGTYAVYPFKKYLSKKLYSNVYKKAKQIICVSKFTQQKFLERIQVNNTLVINNGVDYKKFQTAEPTRQVLKSGKVIVGVGALMFRKGYHISIPAVAEIKKQHPDLKYYLIGNQENKNYFKLLQRLVKKHRLESNVIFLEKISDQKLIKLYHLADLFLLTPISTEDDKFEGFGLVYLEANACGKPVIGTYNCGAEDAVEDGFNGFLVPQNNIEKTSQAIIKILDNPELARKMGDNGKKKAKNMSWQKTAENYIEVYNKFSKFF